MAEQRWWQRPGDGIVFMMRDPDHIARMLREGWREVERPDATPIDPPPPATPPETPAQIAVRQAQNDAACAAFSGKAPTGKSAAKVKAIKPAAAIQGDDNHGTS